VIRYSPKEYWTQLAGDFGQTDHNGFAPVLHPGAPDWFNEAIDRLQARAWDRAINCCSLGNGAEILDVGCGTGRWLRRLDRRGFSVAGIDQSVSMLQLARERGTRPPVFAGELQHLPFRNESFDCVSGVTVVQHIPLAEQVQALKEMMRVLRPGGYLILFELIRGQGPHVFSRTPADWTLQVSAMGAKRIVWFGQEFLVCDRLMVALAQGLRQVAGYGAAEALPGKSQEAGGNLKPGAFSRRIYWALRRISVVTSIWIEPLAGKICPQELATHGVFLFQKLKAVG
jgi:SAM-dependent methyltransferase